PDRPQRAPRIGTVVPVIRTGRPRSGLAAGVEPAALSGFLGSQSLPSDWTGTIIDRDGFVVARSRMPETWLGRPVGALLGRLEGPAGWIRGVDGDGVAAYAAYSRSVFTGWTVAIAVPAETVDAPLRGSLLLAVAGGLTVLLGGVADAPRAVDANPAAEDLFGIPRERLLGRRLHDAALPGDVEPLWLGLQTKGSLVGGLRLLRPDGSERDVELSATAHVLPGRHVAVVRDVTARRQVEEDLRRREREATAMADLSRRMNERLDLDAILRLVCETARELCAADSAAIALPGTEPP